MLVGYLPKMQFRNKSVLVYQEPVIDRASRPGVQLFRSLNMKEQQKNTYTGRLTRGAKKRLTKAITLMVKGTRRRWIYNPVTKGQQVHQLSFITLTISDITQKLDGKTAYKKLLSKFLGWLRDTKNVNTYIWKAELTKKDQIHYHITLPDFIHYREIRDKWNDLQRKAGLLDRYHEEHGHWDPNSTDVHKVYKIKDVCGYLVKEIAKSCQNEKSLGGKVWDCSANLSESKYFCNYMEENHWLFLEGAAEEGLAEKYEGEKFTIYSFTEPVEEYLLTERELEGYRTWLAVLEGKIQFTDPQCPL